MIFSTGDFEKNDCGSMYAITVSISCITLPALANTTDILVSCKLASIKSSSDAMFLVTGITMPLVINDATSVKKFFIAFIPDLI